MDCRLRCVKAFRRQHDMCNYTPFIEAKSLSVYYACVQRGYACNTL